MIGFKITPFMRIGVIFFAIGFSAILNTGIFYGLPYRFSQRYGFSPPVYTPAAAPTFCKFDGWANNCSFDSWSANKCMEELDWVEWKFPYYTAAFGSIAAGVMMLITHNIVPINSSQYIQHMFHKGIEQWKRMRNRKKRGQVYSFKFVLSAVLEISVVFLATLAAVGISVKWYMETHAALDPDYSPGPPEIGSRDCGGVKTFDASNGAAAFTIIAFSTILGLAYKLLLFERKHGRGDEYKLQPIEWTFTKGVLATAIYSLTYFVASFFVAGSIPMFSDFVAILVSMIYFGPPKDGSGNTLRGQAAVLLLCGYAGAFLAELLYLFIASLYPFKVGRVRTQEGEDKESTE